jgi:hypothetical protein
VENLLWNFSCFSLSNFVEKTFLRNIATLRIDKEKRIYFFFSSASSWKCFYLCFYCCARTFGELLRKRIETSTALREGLIEAQAAAFFFLLCQIRVHTTGGKTSEGIDVLV